MSEKNILDRIKWGVLRVADPNDEYSQDDFNKEFLTAKQGINNFKLDIEFVNKSNNDDPNYMTIGASAFDLRANLPEGTVVIDQGCFKLIPTGLYFKLPPNFEIQVRPRSGLANKYGVTVLNSPGTIDADYRGEIGVILINHGINSFVVNHGDRIAQAVVATVITTSNAINLKRVDEILADTERGAGGFGSTGLS